MRFPLSSVIKWGTDTKLVSFARRIHKTEPIIEGRVPEDEQKKSPAETPVKDLLENAAVFDDTNPDTPEQQWSTMPYAKGVKIRSQGAHAVRPKIDPKETSIILFPGQGTQYVGMAKDLLKYPMAKDLFKLANYVLGYNLLKICLEGPKSELEKTIHCQPAVMVTSLAALERLKEERPNAIDSCIATAGFSLGEITSLVFAGALDFEDALRLLKVRAEAMQLASEAYRGTMATVFYGPDSQLNYACLRAREWCTERGVENPDCCVANYLYPHCKVVAGSEEAIKYLEANAKEFKLRKVRRLPVSGAFHSSLMRPAVEPFRKALKKIRIEDPIISVHSNVDGKRYRNADHIKQQLPKQIVKPVRWEQTLHVLYERDQGEHFPRTFVCGPHSNLSSILREVNSKAHGSCHIIEG